MSVDSNNKANCSCPFTSTTKKPFYDLKPIIPRIVSSDFGVCRKWFDLWYQDLCFLSCDLENSSCRNFAKSEQRWRAAVSDVSPSSYSISRVSNFGTDLRWRPVSSAKGEMSMEALGEDRGGNIHTTAPRTDLRVWRLEEQDEELLPGLPNEIVLHQVIPKLPWKAFHVLSSVSRCWQQAIQSRQIYEARVRSHSTETLIGFNDRVSADVYGISLYSSRDKSWYRLPPIPHVHSRRGIPPWCQCVSLDGKVYVMGGEMRYHDFQDEDDYHENFKAKRFLTEVYVMDLAGQTGWKQRASMPEPREFFECGIMDGKIYLFGGRSSLRSTPRSFVYDTKENTWSSIMPMETMRFDYHIVTVGEELFVHGGRYVDRIGIGRTGIRAGDHYPGSAQKPASFLEVYHPGKDKWRLVDPFTRKDSEVLFTVKGKLHVIDSKDIHIYEIERGENVRTHLHWFLLPNNHPGDRDGFQVCALQAVDEELLAIVKLKPAVGEVYHTLFRSNGFGREEKQMLWETVDSSVSFPFDSFIAPKSPPLDCLVGLHFMCSIQL